MISFMWFASAAYIWVKFGHRISYFLYSASPDPIAITVYNYAVAIYGTPVILIWAIFSGAREGGGKRWSDAIMQSAPMRFLVGMSWEAVLFACSAAVAYVVASRAVGQGTASLVLAAMAAAWVHPFAKVAIGRGSRPLRQIFATRHHSLGGSARIAGMLDEWAHPWKPGQILLGLSMYNPWAKIGISDDRHVITIATSRSGKGRSVIIPNLLTWPGSALVIDPKGQNAAITALARGKGGPGLSQCLGQTVRILDPLGEIRDPELRKLVARFNPIIELDATKADYAERVFAIADALVVPSSDGKDSAFFDNAARMLIAGLIDYVRMSSKIPNGDRNLATVRGLLVHPDGPPVDDMIDLGGLAQSGAAGIKQGGENSTADVIFTAMTHTNWLDTLGMQNALAESDFSLTDLNNGTTTIYLVIPPQYLHIHGRFLRLFVNLSIQAATEGRKGKHATLFLLDEFYSLGRLSQLSKAAAVLAGYGVKLWPIIHNISQAKELYPENWETFLGNAGIWTAFAMNDQTTMEYLAYKLGKRVLWRKMRGPQGFEWELAGAASLRDAAELGKATSRESKRLVAFTESSDAYLLRRAAYDAVFPRSRYSPDPFEKPHWTFRAMWPKRKKARPARERTRRQAEPAKQEAPLLTHQPAEPVIKWEKGKGRRRP